MVIPLGGACETDGGLLRRGCGLPAISSCVYCGRRFCAEHGERGADHVDVCGRRRCIEKQRDVDAHVEWRRRVGGANGLSTCAEDGCGERMRHRCARCRLMFCAQHISELTLTNDNGGSVQRRRELVCTHCRGRRRLWR